MGAIFVILFLGIVLLKHFGAVIRDADHDNYLRQRAESRGENIYYAHDGERCIKNNHKVRVEHDKYLGQIITDLVTGEKCYQGIKDLMEEYYKWKGRDDYRDHGDTWGGNLGQVIGYVDKATEEIYYLACVDAGNDANRNGDYGRTWFYVSLDRKHIIRKTKKQKEIDAKSSHLQYTMQEIEQYVDIYVGNKHGTPVCREEDGRWVPQYSESNCF